MPAIAESQLLDRIRSSFLRGGRSLLKLGAGERASFEQIAEMVALAPDSFWKRGLEGTAKASGKVQVIDMFCGCGGMSAGFALANSVHPAYRLLASVDIDPVANQTYEENFGIKPEQEDISRLAADRSRLSRFMSSHGYDPSLPLVLIGCAPCQGFSSHRNTKGAGDQRNSLFLDFAKVATEIRPDVILVENVPEIITDKYWGFIQKARRKLNGAGYSTYLAVHNMAGFGVPQERFRALIIAMKGEFDPPLAFLDRNGYRTVRDAIGRLPDVPAGDKKHLDILHYSAGHQESTIETIRAVPHDGGSRPDGVGPACLNRAKERSGKAAYEDVYGRLAWDRPAITITAHARNPASGRYVHPIQDRGLTIREAALLQSFPTDFKFTGSLDACFRQIGNAVPPAFSAHLAIHILGELTKRTSASTEAVNRGIKESIGPSFSRIIPALKAGTRIA